MGEDRRIERLIGPLAIGTIEDLARLGIRHIHEHIILQQYPEVAIWLGAIPTYEELDAAIEDLRNTYSV